MEVDFKREMNRNYMILKPVPGVYEKYTIHMLENNPIPGLLPFHQKGLNGDIWYYYDITSKQPLNRILEYRKMKGEEIRCLMKTLLLTLKEMERYLLDESQLCLKPEMIYVEPDTFRCHLCMVPGCRESFSDTFCGLAQYLLDHVDHNDGEAVILAFGIFKEGRKGNFGIEDLQECLRTIKDKNDEEEKKEADRPTKEDMREESLPLTTAESVTWESDDESKPDHGLKNKKALLLIPAAAILLLGFLSWKFPGISNHLWILGAMGFLAAAGVILMRGRGKDTLEQPAEEWEMETYITDENRGFEEEELSLKESPPEEEMQTILLTARPIDPENHYLIPLKGGPEIIIGYFPFIIGKNKEIADYCLNSPEVSRLHLKIEKAESGYFVTDLNSTNGTKINGDLLEANETHILSPGDELTIATQKYRFL